MELSNFETALSYIKNGGAISRKGWNGKGMWVCLQRPAPLSKMSRPYLFMCVPKGTTNQFETLTDADIDMVPWLPSQTDLMATDWNLHPMSNEA